MRQLTQVDLINSLSISNEKDVTFLLGAGCSINSGCMAANKLIFEFKKRIYCIENGIRYTDSTLISDSNFLKKITSQDDSSIVNPYSYYFEKCFPSIDDRCTFIKNKFEKIKPSYGYLCFANYLISHSINYVLTTNFDHLCEKSIQKIDDNFDMAVTSDALSPNLLTKLNIVKLHGDFIYDKLKNTVEELDNMSVKIKNDILKITTKKIVVIGYSGQDNSVMEFFDEYLQRNPSTELYWCILNGEATDNTKINSLICKNSNSAYCLIEGFDELFINFHTIFGKENETLNAIINTYRNDAFPFKINNQPEKLMFNCFSIENSPQIYRLKHSLYETSTLRQLNEENDDFFAIGYKEYVYLVGNKNCFIDKINLTFADIEIVDLCEQQIPLWIKEKAIKEIIKISAKQNGIGVFHDNLYIAQSEQIKEGLHISVDMFNGQISLVVNVNYFVTNKEVDDAIKYKINKVKSNLYAQKNYSERALLMKKIFKNGLQFDSDISHISFSNLSLGNSDNSDVSNEYNCAVEPVMIGTNQKSVNQIKLITENGPRKTLFSTDHINIGIFCIEEDKRKLKEYLDMLIDGTNFGGTDLIPQYKGFQNTFHKKLDIIYDALPKFYLNNIGHISFEDFSQMCLRGIDKMYNEKQIDIALIYIGNNLKKFRNCKENDLHDYIKLKCANKFKTQFLEEKTLQSTDNINKKIMNMAIGIYTKTIGMSWYPENYSKDTLFLGISFGVDSNGINVGCSQMFDGAGRGLQLIIAPVTDKHKKNQYLSTDEAFNLGVKIRQTYYKSSKIEELKRIVIHRADPFRKVEIDGFKMAFEGIDDFDLIQISDYSFFNAYRLNNGQCYGYPVKRGTTIKATQDTAYVWTDGSINNYDITEGRTYRNNKRGMGKPLKIRKFYGNITLNEVVDDLMYLTKMDFNSSDVIYSKLPVTIKYSQIVCDLLKQGSFNDDLISFEYIM